MFSKVNDISKNILNYLPRRRNARLFQQWVKYAALPVKEILPDLHKERSVRVIDFALDDLPRENIRKYTSRQDIDREMIHLPVQYVMVGIFTIIILLVVLSIAIVVIITQ